ncbi:MAG: rRNA maturation RNase YbeY [Holophagaceae bacterium]
MGRPSKDFWLDVQNRSRHRPPSSRSLLALVTTILRKESPRTEGVGLIFVDDAEMKRINTAHRKKQKTTDVLSFPSHLPNGAYPYLGDVVISLSLARTLAKSAGVSTTRYCSTLLIHGLLHLCGYDHEKDKGEMMKRQAFWERRALKSYPLPMERP